MIQMGELVSAEAMRRYDDNGDPIYSTYERVLLALRWFGWVTAERLFLALDLDYETMTHADRHVYSNAIKYWVKRGRVEVRRDHSSVEYCLLHPSRWAKQTQCTRCPSDVAPGKTMCQRHLDWERDYKRSKRAA